MDLATIQGQLPFTVEETALRRLIAKCSTWQLTPVQIPFIIKDLMVEINTIQNESKAKLENIQLKNIVIAVMNVAIDSSSTLEPLEKAALKLVLGNTIDVFYTLSKNPNLFEKTGEAVKVGATPSCFSCC